MKMFKFAQDHNALLWSYKAEPAKSTFMQQTIPKKLKLNGVIFFSWVFLKLSEVKKKFSALNHNFIYE